MPSETTDPRSFGYPDLDSIGEILRRTAADGTRNSHQKDDSACAPGGVVGASFGYRGLWSGGGGAAVRRRTTVSRVLKSPVDVGRVDGMPALLRRLAEVAPDGAVVTMHLMNGELPDSLRRVVEAHPVSGPAIRGWPADVVCHLPLETAAVDGLYRYAVRGFEIDQVDELIVTCGDDALVSAAGSLPEVVASGEHAAAIIPHLRDLSAEGVSVPVSEDDWDRGPECAVLELWCGAQVIDTMDAVVDVMGVGGSLPEVLIPWSWYEEIWRDADFAVKVSTSDTTLWYPTSIHAVRVDDVAARERVSVECALYWGDRPANQAPIMRDYYVNDDGFILVRLPYVRTPGRGCWRVVLADSSVTWVPQNRAPDLAPVARDALQQAATVSIIRARRDQRADAIEELLAEHGRQVQSHSTSWRPSVAYLKCGLAASESDLVVVTDEACHAGYLAPIVANRGAGARAMWLEPGVRLYPPFRPVGQASGFAPPAELPIIDRLSIINVLNATG